MRKHLRALTAQLRADLRQDTERGKLIRSAGSTAAIKVGATGIAFLASLLYARALGPHGYGLYAYVIAWVMLLTIPVTMGLPGYLVREGAKAVTSTIWLRTWADSRVLIPGLGAAAVMSCIWFFPQAAGARQLFVVAALLPLLNALGSIRSALLQSQGWVARSQWPTQLAGPSLMLGVLAALWLWRGQLHPVELVIAMLASSLLQLTINGWQLHVVTHGKIASKPTPARVKAALPFMWLSAMYLVNTRVDLIMLGSLRGAHDAGIYAIAMRTAELVPFLLIVANLTVAPRISKLYHAGDMEKLQRLTSATALRVLLATVPLALPLVIGAHLLLRLFYGVAFVEGASVIRILAVSQLLVVALGPVGVLLNMTAHANLSARAFGISSILNIILNGALIPFYGMEGSAIATGTSALVACLIRWRMVRNHLGLKSSAFNY